METKIDQLALLIIPNTVSHQNNFSNAVSKSGGPDRLCNSTDRRAREARKTVGRPVATPDYTLRE